MSANRVSAKSLSYLAVLVVFLVVAGYAVPPASRKWTSRRRPRWASRQLTDRAIESLEIGPGDDVADRGRETVIPSYGHLPIEPLESPSGPISPRRPSRRPKDLPFALPGWKQKRKILLAASPG